MRPSLSHGEVEMILKRAGIEDILGRGRVMYNFSLGEKMLVYGLKVGNNPFF